ncbi:hypothetical protein LINGRAHAP2_LOCUS30318 [Linum grandiflorum]
MFSYGNPMVVSVEMISEMLQQKCFYFNLRWADFVEKNGVEEGDFLVFNFIGDETANVVVYDSSCCIKGLKVKKKQQVGSFTQTKRSRNEKDEESVFSVFSYTDSMICEIKRVKREAPQLWANFVEENGVEKSDFLVFNFTGDRTVNVVVYHSSGYVKGLKVKKEQQVGSFTQKKRFQQRPPYQRHTLHHCQIDTSCGSLTC